MPNNVVVSSVTLNEALHLSTHCYPLHCQVHMYYTPSLGNGDDRLQYFLWQFHGSLLLHMFARRYGCCLRRGRFMGWFVSLATEWSLKSRGAVKQAYSATVSGSQNRVYFTPPRQKWAVLYRWTAILAATLPFHVGFRRVVKRAIGFNGESDGCSAAEVSYVCLRETASRIKMLADSQLR